MSHTHGSAEKHETKTESKAPGFGTTVIHAGQDPDSVTGAVCVPISLATTFVQKSPGKPMVRADSTFVDAAISSGLPQGGFEYSRSGNPTRVAFEACVAAAEGGKYGALTCELMIVQRAYQLCAQAWRFRRAWARLPRS